MDGVKGSRSSLVAHIWRITYWIKACFRHYRMDHATRLHRIIENVASMRGEDLDVFLLHTSDGVYDMYDATDYTTIMTRKRYFFFNWCMDQNLPKA